ncbi:hypothetical protein [Rhodococcus pyridinivorans]|uniref:hypothetical protein n=1 Tax=Rhodococcus pyridinivorans TaxID=103816 RepID=UPI00265A8A98|nr:hypothetical protein [Rhodococcus pyridinivorans]
MTCPFLPTRRIGDRPVQELVVHAMRTADGAVVELEEIGTFPIAGNRAVALGLLNDDSGKSTAGAKRNPLDAVRSDLRRAFAPRKAALQARRVIDRHVHRLRSSDDPESIELVSKLFTPIAAEALLVSLGLEDEALEHETVTFFEQMQAEAMKSLLSPGLLVLARRIVTSSCVTPGGFLENQQLIRGRSTDDLSELVVLLLMAGVEPVANLTAMTAHTLLSEPRYPTPQAAYDHVVREDSPIYPGLYRTSKQALSINGHDHPAGTLFFVPVVATDVSERHFTFGAGPRRCVGQALAEKLVLGTVHALVQMGVDRVRECSWRAQLPRGLRSLHCSFADGR